MGMAKRKVGILGGTFQPIHNGHLEMARLARDTLSLDEVIFLIAGQPPHKVMQGDASDADRLEMVRLATACERGFSVSTEELSRKGPSYTVDTLRRRKAAFPDEELTFIMGSDMLRFFPNWREPAAVAQLSDIACVTRAGQSGGEKEAADRIEREYGGHVHLLGSVAGVSSTDVRRRASEALPLTEQLPDSVYTYLILHMLYQPEDIEQYFLSLRAALSEGRFTHSLYTVKRAIEMAAQYGCDAKKARLAALLHDCAKQLPKEKQEILSGEDLIVPPVLHACAGAVVAKTVYGVQDDAVLRAIRLHSTGDADMTTLDKVLYMADITEQSRDFPGVDKLRQEKDLDRALLLAIEGTLCYIQERGLPIHPSSLRAYQYLGGKA